LPSGLPPRRWPRLQAALEGSQWFPDGVDDHPELMEDEAGFVTWHGGRRPARCHSGRSGVRASGPAHTWAKDHGLSVINEIILSR